MRVCPKDGAILDFVFQGVIMNYYKCSKCGERFKGFAGDSDEITPTVSEGKLK